MSTLVCLYSTELRWVQAEWLRVTLDPTDLLEPLEPAHRAHNDVGVFTTAKGRMGSRPNDDGEEQGRLRLSKFTPFRAFFDSAEFDNFLKCTQTCPSSSIDALLAHWPAFSTCSTPRG